MTSDDEHFFVFIGLINVFFFFFLIFYWIIGFGVHVKNMQDSCTGTHLAVWFAAFLPFTYIWHFFPCYLFPTPYPMLSLPYSPNRPQCLVLPSVSMCSHCSTLTYEWEYAVFHFLFLCQFAEDDVFQIRPCPYKGHKLIIFDGCIISHGVYVPHFPVQSIIDGHWVGSRSLLL